MDNFYDLSNVELKNKLISLKEELDDLERERHLFFEQTGMHVVSDKINLQSQQYEKEILDTEEQIGKLAAEIKRRGI